MNVTKGPGPDEKYKMPGVQVPDLMEEISRIGNHSLEDWSKAIRAEVSVLNITIDRFMEAGLAIELLRPLRANVLKSLGYDPDETRSKAFIEVALWETFKREDPEGAAKMYQDLILRASQNDETATQKIEFIRTKYEDAGFSSSYFDIIPKTKPDEWHRIRRAVHRIIGSVVIGQTTEQIMISHNEILRVLGDIHRSSPDEYEGAVNRIFSFLKDERVRGVLDEYNRATVEERGPMMRTSGDRLLGLLDQNERMSIGDLSNPSEKILMFFNDMYKVMRGERIVRFGLIHQ